MAHSADSTAVSVEYAVLSVLLILVTPAMLLLLDFLRLFALCFVDNQTGTMVKSFEVCTLPVRCARFIVRKQWFVTASDDMHVRVFNYNTMEKVGWCCCADGSGGRWGWSWSCCAVVYAVGVVGVVGVVGGLGPHGCCYWWWWWW